MNGNEIINKISCEIAHSGAMNITNDGAYACAEGLQIIGVLGVLITLIFVGFIGLFNNRRKSK